MIGAGVVVAESARSIDILPTLEPRPPIWIEDFPGEYSALNTKRLRGFCALRHVGDLSIRATEPGPFEFVRGREGASSAVRLDLSYRQRQVRNQAMPPPVMAQGQMASRLKAVTFISVVAQHRAPTLHQAAVSPSLTRTSKVCGREQHQTFSFNPWRCASGESYSFGPETHLDWVTEATVILHYDDEVLLAPTFFHPLVSRKYSLLTRLAVRGPGYAAFNLEVPIQVVYKAAAGRERAPDHHHTLREVIDTSGTSPAYSEELDCCVGPGVELPRYVR
ncbi:MAG: hypothetical protein M1830_000080 [Pleopsidium flavum]|nr:MAG: hypothetical protein M1830_000080 [Pleopsidium flavum]